MIFFLFLNENICCGYSLEVPQRGTSNEYHNMFSLRNKKNIVIFQMKKSALSVAMHNMCFLVVFFFFVCVEVLWPSQPNGVMSSAVSLPNHTLLGRLSPLSG